MTLHANQNINMKKTNHIHKSCIYRLRMYANSITLVVNVLFCYFIYLCFVFWNTENKGVYFTFPSFLGAL